jgi:hypothetical protein
MDLLGVTFLLSYPVGKSPPGGFEINTYTPDARLEIENGIFFRIR